MNLQRLMDAKKMNQVELAKHSGVGQGLISSYLHAGKAAQFPSLKNLLALSRALGCTPNDLLGWPEKKPFSERVYAAWEAFSKLPPDHPHRKAIEALLGIDLSTGPEKGETHE